jgi:hypothetical protein
MNFPSISFTVLAGYNSFRNLYSVHMQVREQFSVVSSDIKFDTE